MRSPCNTAVFCLCLALGVLGGSGASGQLIQGSDGPSTFEFTNPATWTSTILDEELDKTVEFKLKPCEYVLYWDSAGAARTCLPRASQALCDKLDEMEDKLLLALGLWESLNPTGDGLDLSYGGIVGSTCPTSSANCPATDGWEEDGQWVATRTYVPTEPLPEELCPDAATPPSRGGTGLRFYYDDPNDDATRSVVECDVVFGEYAWDTAPQYGCRQEGIDPDDCVAATTASLANEIGHCFWFGHSYLTRKSLVPLAGYLFTGFGLTLQEALPSVMAYDHPGSIEIGQNGVHLPDEGLYLATYAEPDPAMFAAFGTARRRPQFAAGFEQELTAQFSGPGSGDDADTICVEF